MIPARVRSLLPRRIKAHRILAGPLQGSRIVTSWHDYPAAITGRTEAALLTWFERHVRPGQTWLDVGGHYGYTAIALARLTGPQGRVFTFEPVISTAGCIAETRRLNGLAQLVVVPIGLGAPATIETVAMPLTRGMADRTIVSDGADLHERILVARFDWLWNQLHEGNPRVDGIKIDVQGMELAVIQGLLATIRASRPLLALELHQGVDRQAVRALLESAGYSRPPIPIEPVPGETEARLIDDRSYAFLPS